MRAIYLTRNYSPHDRRFLTALARTDHSVHYLPLINAGWDRARRELPPQVIVEEPLQVLSSIHWLQYPGLSHRLKRHLERIKPDIVHAGPIHSGATLVALTGFHPLVSMSWGSDLLRDTRAPLVALAARYTLRKSDTFVGDCQAVKSAAVRYGMDQERIVVFPWGVDLKHFSPGSGIELRRKLGWEGKFILISTRSFEPLYGVDLIVKAFIQLAPQFPELRLLLLGEGSKRDAFKSSLEDDNLLQRVFFAGVADREALPEYYRSADIYVSASRSDGSSVSLMEALSSGLPALVSDIPGNCEWVQPGVNGWRFRDGDVDSLIEALCGLLRKRDGLGELGGAARTIAESRANWDENFPNLLKAYEIAVARVSKSP